MATVPCKIVQFARKDGVVKIGINVQYLEKTKYVETQVPDSGSELDILQSAWDAVSGGIEAWEQEVVSASTKSFHIEETPESYTVMFTERFWGTFVAVSETVAKSSAPSLADAVSQAWTTLEPQVVAWKTNVLQNNLVQGRYFRVQNGQPILEPNLVNVV